MDNCKPLLKITSISKGGISYKCPVPMSDKEREFKATKFIIESCREKDRNMKFYDVLAYELIEASKNQVIDFELLILFIDWNIDKDVLCIL